MSIGPWQIVVIVLLILVLFGKGKISGLMGDFAQGIKAFKKGMQDDTAHASSGEDAKALKSETGEDAVASGKKDKTASS